MTTASNNAVGGLKFQQLALYYIDRESYAAFLGFATAICSCVQDNSFCVKLFLALVVFSLYQVWLRHSTIGDASPRGKPSLSIERSPTASSTCLLFPQESQVGCSHPTYSSHLVLAPTERGRDFPSKVEREQGICVTPSSIEREKPLEFKRGRR